MPNGQSDSPPHDACPQAPEVVFEKRAAPRPEGVPSLGLADTGKTAWESRLVERLRLKQ